MAEITEQRILDIESKLIFILRRLDLLERGRTNTEPQPAPQAPTPPAAQPKPISTPNVVVEAPVPAFDLPVHIPPPPKQIQPTTPPQWPRQTRFPDQKPPKSISEMEYDLGAKVLPWVGGLLMVVAIGLFVAMTMRRYSLTPEAQVTLSILGSLGFIAFGMFKKNMREGFGALLVGIGSCGMFLSFTSGCVYHHLYPGKVMVALYFGWSLVNLAYGHWLKSPWFVSLGFAGGVAASLMAFADHNMPMFTILYLSILTTSAITSSIRKWWGLLPVGWLITMGLSFLAETFNGTYQPSIYGPLLVTIGTTVSIAAFQFAIREDFFEGTEHFGGAAAFLAAPTLLLMQQNNPTYLLILSGVTTALGFAFKGKVAWKSLIYGGLAGASIFAPFTARVDLYGYIFCGLAAVYALGSELTNLLPTESYRPKARLSAVTFAWIELTLGFFIYATKYGSGQPELNLIGVLIPTTLLVTFMQYRQSKNAEVAILSAIALVTPLLSRLTFLIFEPAPTTNPQNGVLALSFLWASMSLAFALTNVKKWMSFSVCGWIGVIAAFGAYISVSSPYSLEVPLLAVLIAAFTANSWRTRPLVQQNELSSFQFLISTGGHILAARTIYVLLAKGLNMSHADAEMLCLCIPAVAGLVVGRQLQSVPIIAPSLALIGLGTAGYALSAPRLIPVHTSILIVTWLAVAALTTRFKDKHPIFLAATFLVQWFLTSDLFGRHLQNMGLSQEWAYSAAWGIFAAIALAIGFVTQWRLLRFGSFGVFAVTIGKIVLVDLAQQVDPATRVLIFAFLGASMLIGGYFYIRNRSKIIAN